MDEQAAQRVQDQPAAYHAELMQGQALASLVATLQGQHAGLEQVQQDQEQVIHAVQW